MRRLLGWLGAVALAAIAFVLVMRLMFPVPPTEGRAPQAALPPDPGTLLGAQMAAGAALHPGLSGVVALADGHDALASRLALAEVAQRSIDAQYYIWHDDTSGILLLDAYRRAAARGVRVRLLLDDNGVHGLDPIMATLDALPNLEIRLFNPSTIRRPKMLGYTFDFARMNRRMHNKAMIADGAAAIIGGRNIGDEYFQVGDAFYLDMDALATGPIVADTAAIFDDYWNSASVIEAGRVLTATPDPAAFDARLAEVRASDAARDLRDGLSNSAARYAQGGQALEWVRVSVMADDPVKGEGRARADQLLIARLAPLLQSAQHRIDLASAYFVPGRAGTALLAGIAQSGRDLRVLTNALNTTDVVMVHAGYTKYRRDLLKAGVRLYELKLRANATPESGHQLMPFGLSGASLHAKTFALDARRVFIGSFNFDPRSAHLNCEMGFLIDSPTMARRVSDGFDGPLDAVSYRPQLSADGRMVWQETTAPDQVVTWQQEPGADWLTQAALVVIGLLPVEWLL